MFLPNSLPTALLKLRQKTQFVNKPTEVNNNQTIDWKFAASVPAAMVSLRKKRNHNSNYVNGLTTTTTNVVATTASTSKAPLKRPSLLTRGWERISRRKKRTKQIDQPTLQKSHNEQNMRSKPSTSGTFPNAWDAESNPSNVASTSAEVQNCVNGTSRGKRQDNNINIRQDGNVNGGVAIVSDIQSIAEEDTNRRHFLHRGMDRIRQSFRRGTSSTTKKGGQSLTGGRGAGQAEQPSSSTGSSLNGAGLGSNGQRTGKNYCLPDEAAVRSTACSFNVKYLGSCEVYESRGMHVCEGALQHLRAKKRATKSILYVSGDGIRVVDHDKNRGGLILDQTIEKVSFCAPDRHNDKGFAYICRDGATRRWMCHGFQATKESGERLSHAVGCAFNVCLEKKRKRDAETAAYKSAQALAASSNGADPSGLNVDWDSVEPVGSAARNNAAYSSFRRSLSIAERKIDPQTAIIHNPPPLPCTTTQQGQQPMSHALPSQSTRNSLTISGFNSSFSMDEYSSVAKPRPVANPLLFERQGSFKAPVHPSYSQPSFKRFNSLRGGFELDAESQDMFGQPNSTFKTLKNVKTLHNEPIYEGDDDELEWPHHQQQPKTYTQVRTTATPPHKHNILAAGEDSDDLDSGNRPSTALRNSLSLQYFGNLPPNSSQQQIFNSPLWSTSIRTTPTPQNADMQKENQGKGEDSSTRSMKNSISLTGFDSGRASCRDSQSAACTSRSSKADDWLEQAFKDSMTFPSPSHSSIGQQQNNPPNCSGGLRNQSINSAAFSEPHPPSQPPPPLRLQQVNLEKGLLSGERDQELASLSPPQKSISSSNQGHSRKASGGAVRLSIEYQLLEETDAPPQSPPLSSKSISFHIPNQQVRAFNTEKQSLPTNSYSTLMKPKMSMQERTIYAEDDPFDVQWSTIVLQNSSLTSRNNCHSPASSSIRHSTSHNSLPSTNNGKHANGVVNEDPQSQMAPLTPTKTSLYTNPFSCESTPVNV